MKKLRDYEITEIELYPWEGTDTPEVFSADIVLEDKYLVQIGTDKDLSIPRSHNRYWNDEKLQDEFWEKYYSEIEEEDVEYFFNQCLLAKLNPALIGE